jgi:hypothetical protein
MNDGTEWLIVDTETDGLYDPVHIIEIAAQRMRGWEPACEPFRILLNHDIPISKDVVAIHGYTADFLAKNGVNPAEAHAKLRDYADGLAFVSHNLAFDWNRCFDLEWQRLDVEQFGTRGFCALTLARRLIHESPKHSLETLKEVLDLKANISHRALNDVATLVELFQGEYRYRLEAAGITSFDEIVKFSKTPIVKCHELVIGSTPTNSKPIKTASKPKKVIDQQTAVVNAAPNAVEIIKGLIISGLKKTSVDPKNVTVDAWYYLDSDNKPAGPLPSFIISEYVMRNKPSFYVWRAGMKEWERHENCSDYNACYESSKYIPTPNTKSGLSSVSINELAKMCRGIVNSGKVTSHEVYFLGDWLMKSGLGYTWPGTEIAALIEKILEDGVITQDERNELATLVSQIYK